MAVKLSNEGIKFYSEYKRNVEAEFAKGNREITPLPLTILKETSESVIVEVVKTSTEFDQQVLDNILANAEEVEFDFASEATFFQDAFKQGAKSVDEALKLTLEAVAKGRETGGYNDLKRAEMKAIADRNLESEVINNA